MASQIEFCFDFASPYSYLAATQLPALSAATCAEIVYRPFRLLELMKIVGNRPTTIECKNKGQYASADIGRWPRATALGHVRRCDWA
jgi:2-hydroxychromene-2-carboxylate isomerase